MHTRTAILLSVSLLISAPSFAKDKKPILPPYVLSAHTVAVIIDPNAGLSLDNPQANRIAQQDVETALASWGRLQLVPSTRQADLIIVLHKGSGRPVNQTLPDPRQDRTPGSLDPSDSSANIGPQQGRLGAPSGPPSPQTQAEIGAADDSFTVYQGGLENPLDNPPAWRYSAQDALHPHSVPAVAEFRKALTAAAKAAAKQP